MEFAIGNAKLGTGCQVVSRAVGDTCPPDCHFLGNGCYAQSTENIFKGSRIVGLRNLITDRNRIRSMIMNSIKTNRSIRWHERGDFLLNGKLDNNYINHIVWACESILADGHSLPDMWSYTHFYSPVIVRKLAKYMKLYASVHNSSQRAKAYKAGFRLFAWIDTDHQYTDRKNAKAKNAVEVALALPKMVVIDNDRYITCPEMRRGRQAGGVTCTGNKNTLVCNLCVRGLANVLFVDHS